MRKHHLHRHAELVSASPAKCLLLCLLLASTLLSSCATADRCARKFPATTVTERVVELRDTTIYLPGATVVDTLSWPILLPCADVAAAHQPGTRVDNGNKVSLAPRPAGPRLLGVARQGSATVRTYLLPDGRITAHCTCDSTQHTLKGALRKETTDTQATRTIEVPVRGLVYWLGWVFVALLALSALYLIVLLIAHLRP
jgi:hypothetical protein